MTDLDILKQVLIKDFDHFTDRVVRVVCLCVLVRACVRVCITCACVARVYVVYT